MPVAKDLFFVLAPEFFFGLFHLVFRKDVADRDDDVSLAQAAGLNHDSFVVSGVDMLDAPGRELVFVNENYELAFGECHTIAPFSHAPEVCFQQFDVGVDDIFVGIVEILQREHRCGCFTSCDGKLETDRVF